MGRNGDVAAPVFPDLRSPEEVFGDYRGRRAGIVKALTQDVDEFYKQCDPEKKNLCLFGRPNGTWEVNLPVDEVPPELPEPSLGINFARDGMSRKDWLTLVAVHCDAWLMSLAFYFGGRFGFDKEARERVFTMINGLPTVFEAVVGIDKKPANIPDGSNKKKHGSKTPKLTNSNGKQTKQRAQPKLEEEEEEEEDGYGGEDGKDESSSSFCGLCGVAYTTDDEFWICCDVCERWFHGDCVNMTSERAGQIDRYRCPLCDRRARSGPPGTKRSRE